MIFCVFTLLQPYNLIYKGIEVIKNSLSICLSQLCPDFPW